MFERFFFMIYRNPQNFMSVVLLRYSDMVINIIVILREVVSIAINKCFYLYWGALFEQKVFIHFNY